MKFAVINTQGFTYNEYFIPKEFSIIWDNKNLHVLVKSPIYFNQLCDKDKRSAHYLINYHHGLLFNSKVHDCIEEKDLLQFIERELVNKNYNTIYVKGANIQRYLLENINIVNQLQIVNLENDSNCPKIVKESIKDCIYHINDDRDYVCSLTNCKTLYEYIINK